MPEIGRARAGISTYLIPRGALTEPASIEALREAFARCLAERELKIVVDFSGVPLVDSAALECLLEQHDALARLGGTLYVAGLNAVIRDVFRLTGLAKQIGQIDAEAVDERAADAAEPRRRIGEILVERGQVDAEMVEKALKLQQKRGRRMAQILVDEGWLAEKDLLQALSEQLGLPFVWLRAGLYDAAVVASIDRDVARRLGVLPLYRVRGTVFLATNDPQSIPTLETVQDLTGCKVRPVLACSKEIQTVLAEIQSGASDLSEYMGDLENELELVESRALEDDAVIDEMAAGSPVVNLINGVVLRAVRDGASDIHIEPGRSRCRVRLRVDGALYTIMTPPLDVHPALVSRLKVMAKLDIAERRLPQDGRIQVVTQGRVVDLRFSSLPGIFGEKIVLRVLDKNQAILDVERLGMSEASEARFKRLLQKSYGLILATGPTGSGKTTTLYAAIHHVATDEKNIVTIEDPVEYQIDTISQNQVREAIGLGFAKILKHVLRQDPDVIMVGEIRERETAQIAVQAALTGHLVLSTLHTNDSAGAVTRMIDMGVEPYLLSSALIGVVAQRLVRKVCPHCRTTYAAPPGALEPYGVKQSKNLRLARGRGCSECYDSGYKGRMAIHEVLECDADLQRLIVSNPARADLEQYIERRGIQTLLHDGAQRAVEGETSLEEVLRVVNN